MIDPSSTESGYKCPRSVIKSISRLGHDLTCTHAFCLAHNSFCLCELRGQSDSCYALSVGYPILESWTAAQNGRGDLPRPPLLDNHLTQWNIPSELSAHHASGGPVLRCLTEFLWPQSCHPTGPTASLSIPPNNALAPTAESAKALDAWQHGGYLPLESPMRNPPARQKRWNERRTGACLSA